MKVLKRNLFSITALFCINLFHFSCTNPEIDPQLFPQPTEKTQVREGQVEGETEGNPKEDWQAMIHRAAPGTDWQAIEHQNRLDNQRYRKQLQNQAMERAEETVANGNLTGEWTEKGSTNQAGNLTAVTFDATSEKIYAVAPGGSLWEGELSGDDWSPLNEDIVFDSRIIATVQTGNGLRIIASIGRVVHYSDDNGATWTPSNGINFVTDFGNAVRMEQADDSNNTLYYLVRSLNNTTYQVEIRLYSSTNNAVSFNQIASFPTFSDENIDMWTAFQASEAYLLDHQSKLYYMTPTGLTLVQNTSLPQNTWRRITGSKASGSVVLYALLNNSQVYKSFNFGSSWTLMGNTPVNAWSVGIEASPWNNEQLIMGEVNSRVSSNSGDDWTNVNQWFEYYSNVDKLHADIITVGAFQKSDGSNFFLIGNHGGLHVTYDDFTTTINLSKSTLNNAEYYDVRTDPTDNDYIYAGSQDQGWQRTSNGNNSGAVPFQQVISGDYGHFAFSNNGQNFWTVYPFGNINFYANPKSGFSNAQIAIGGLDPPVANWIWPTSETHDLSSNDIYLAGGDINGGSGSKLIKLTAANNAGTWSINTSQFSYDFKANSSTGSATISAIEPSYVDPNKLYVATNDGTFFYSNNQGASWSISSSTVAGEFWLYGASIYASQIEANTVWMAGSGYSNAPVFKSTNGGQSFTAMSNGLPNTLVYEITANPDETLIFAATEVGAYVYVVAEDMWYEMMGTAAPLQQYHSVEYVPNLDIVRFGTYGRGIWDFAVNTQAALPVEWLSFTAQAVDNEKIELKWATASEFENDYFEVQKSTNGKDFTAIGEIASLGQGAQERGYEFTDNFPVLGENYYRLKQVDRDGTIEFSEVKVAKIIGDKPTVAVFPNPVNAGEDLQIKISKNGQFNCTLFDANGRMVKQSVTENNGRINTQNLGTGNYFYRVIDLNDGKEYSGKFLVKK